MVDRILTLGINLKMTWKPVKVKKRDDSPTLYFLIHFSQHELTLLSNTRSSTLNLSSSCRPFRIVGVCFGLPPWLSPSIIRMMATSTSVERNLSANNDTAYAPVRKSKSNWDWWEFYTEYARDYHTHIAANPSRISIPYLTNLSSPFTYQKMSQW